MMTLSGLNQLGSHRLLDSGFLMTKGEEGENTIVLLEGERNLVLFRGKIIIKII